LDIAKHYFSIPKRKRYEKFIHIMKFILETERLQLRQFDISDAQKMFELNSDEEVLKYTGDKKFASIEAAKQFLENYNAYSKTGFGRWSVILKSNNEFIGWCGLKYHKEGFVDIGYRFFKKDWNKGYATESAKACLEYGFHELKLKEIIGRAARENVASIRVFEKLKMKFHRNLDNCDGIHDAVIYKSVSSDKL